MTYLSILTLQGVLLFGVALLELREMSAVNFAFILLETVIVKAVAVPLFIRHVIKKNGIRREAEPFVPYFISLIVTTLIIVIAFVLSTMVDAPNINRTYFVVAISAVFSGLFFIVSRKKIITHVICYALIENGVFILSLAVGNEMPLLINLCVMLDIFASVLILGIFINKIGDVFRDADIGELTELRD
jgi:hydrogenase-4 component E